MGPDDPFAQQLFDDAGRLKVSLPCVRCGYDLRTLPRDGCCPECGHTVRETLAVTPSGDAWRLSSPALWTPLGMLATGQWLLAISGLVLLMVWLTPLLDIVPGPLGGPFLAVVAATPCAGVVGFCIMLSGAVGLCDAAARTGLPVGSRGWVRGYLAYQTIQVPLLVLLTIWLLGSRSGDHRIAAAATLCAILLIALALSLSLCARLAERLGCRAQARVLRRLIVAAWALALGAAVLGATGLWGWRMLPGLTIVAGTTHAGARILAASLVAAWTLILGVSALVLWSLTRRIHAVYGVSSATSQAADPYTAPPEQQRAADHRRG